MIIHGGRSRDWEEFLRKAKRWQDIWNKGRESWGIGMGGKTPLEKLEEVHDGLINKKVVEFPVVMLERLSEKVRSAVLWLTVRLNHFVYYSQVVSICVSGAE